MAKKNTRSDNTTPPTGPAPERRRAPRQTTRRTTAPTQSAVEPGGSAVVTAATADDQRRLGNGTAEGQTPPTYEQIAEAAYQRYLQRGRQHGRDFDDWLEAERSLRDRRQ